MGGMATRKPRKINSPVVLVCRNCKRQCGVLTERVEGWCRCSNGKALTQHKMVRMAHTAP